MLACMSLHLLLIFQSRHRASAPSSSATASMQVGAVGSTWPVKVLRSQTTAGPVLMCCWQSRCIVFKLETEIVHSPCPTCSPYGLQQLSSLALIEHCQVCPGGEGWTGTPSCPLISTVQLRPSFHAGYLQHLDASSAVPNGSSQAQPCRGTAMAM